ncbi:MAG: ATP-dependent zinc metalloprotease FtsH [Christensenellaceae bacterium]|nr:ATP-dependent zinc metalloprotease FtsH [Christensenellaceae bacterium]
MRGPLILIIVIVLVIIFAQFMNFTDYNVPDELEYNEFLEKAEASDIKDICIQEYDIYGRYKDSTILDTDFPQKFDFKARIPSVAQFNLDMAAVSGTEDPLKYPFKLNYIAPEEANFFTAFFPYLIPIILLLIMFMFIMRQARSGGAGNAMQFGKSRARMTNGSDTNKTFDDVAGADEEKEELQEIVQFLKAPAKFSRLGARIPKGVLLVGPPGGGKTLLAKAVAGEANVPFFSISGSDFVEMFVGVGASRVRDLFNDAKKNSPCIVFIDEIDAVGRQRGAGLGGGHDEREQTLNQLLVEMDGFNVNEGIIVMAATNRKDILDPALLRPGRFDRQIVVQYPDIKGREEILKVHAKGKPLAPDVDFGVIAKRTPGFIGADLENVLNEAAILAARRNLDAISMKEIEEAITRVIAGPEKKSRVVSENDKRCTAIHEVGHAILAHELEHCDPVHEVSVIQRGMAAGYTMTLPENDRQHIFRSKLVDEITMMLGGRVAESIALDDISTGAVNDLHRATDIAREMVTKYGMSDEVGPVFLSSEHEVFLGREFAQQSNFSQETASKIDCEVKNIIERCYSRAESILKDNIDKLRSIAEVLMQKEKLTGEEFEQLFTTGKLDEDEKPAENDQESVSTEDPQPAAPAEELPEKDDKGFDEDYKPEE